MSERKAGVHSDQSGYNKIDMHGIIYAITSEVINCVKIGYWRGSLQSLKAKYRTRYGPELVVYYADCNNVMIGAETMHEKFKKYRVYEDSELFQKDHLAKYIRYLNDLQEKYDDGGETTTIMSI